MAESLSTFFTQPVHRFSGHSPQVKKGFPHTWRLLAPPCCLGNLHKVACDHFSLRSSPVTTNRNSLGKETVTIWPRRPFSLPSTLPNLTPVSSTVPQPRPQSYRFYINIDSNSTLTKWPAYSFLYSSNGLAPQIRHTYFICTQFLSSLKYLSYYKNLGTQYINNGLFIRYGVLNSHPE